MNNNLKCKVKTNYQTKFFSCDRQQINNLQNMNIEPNNVDGLQQLINIINFMQNIQQNNKPEEKPPHEPNEPIDEPEDEPIDEPMDTPDEEDEPDKPIDEPDYELIFSTIEKEIKETKRPEAAKLKINDTIFLKIETSKLKEQDKMRLHQLRNDKFEELQNEHYTFIINNINLLTTIDKLNLLYNQIANDQILTGLQVSNSLKSINNKIKLLRAEIEFDKISKEIRNEKNVVKLQVDIKDKIDFESTYITDNQKKELHKMRENKIQELQGQSKFEQMMNSIKTENFIGNLIEGRLHDSLINVSGLTNEQKNKLKQTREERLSIVTNKIFDDLKDNIKNERYENQLKDGGYFDDRIGEIRKEYLIDGRNIEDLHRLRRHRIDTLSSESEDKLYDINKELVENLENLEEISDQSEIAKDIINLNQTLLTGNRNIEYLDKLRKAKFQNGFYDNLEASIKIEQNINRLEDFFRDEIDKLDEIYLVPPKDKKSLYNL